MSETKEQFYKLARPDGFDFYTGRTINYREHIGGIARPPKRGKPHLCSDTVIHASRDPNDCFIGASIPCSAYLVEGKPYVKDDNKCGFKQLRVIKELDPKELFQWDYELACNPVHPFKIKPPKITKKHLALLRQWDSVRHSARGSVWYSVWDSAWYSVWGSVGYSVWASAWDSVGGSVWNSARDSVGHSVWDSVGDSAWGYLGFMFKDAIEDWKYVNHKKGEYPFQPAVDLWNMGLVPSFDGNVWRLHGGKNAEILWKEKP